MPTAYYCQYVTFGAPAYIRKLNGKSFTMLDKDADKVTLYMEAKELFVSQNDKIVAVIGDSNIACAMPVDGKVATTQGYTKNAKPEPVKG